MALEVFAIYVMPFLIIGLAIQFLMKRYAVDLPDVEKQVGPKPRRRFLLGLGAPKIEANGLFFNSRTSYSKGHAFWIVLRKPGFCGVRGGENLVVLAGRQPACWC